MPDFVVGQTPKPAAPNFLEADTDDDYSWNSCRYPLRIAMIPDGNGGGAVGNHGRLPAQWIAVRRL